MKVLVTGATGFIGRPLVKRLMSEGHSVVALARDIQSAKEILPAGCEIYIWDPESDNIPIAAAIGVEAVVNLAGESIATIWNKTNKERIYNSRILGTKKLIKLFKSSPFPLQVFIQASAVGIYPDHETDQYYFEESSFGNNFLSKVCIDWEAELNNLPASLRRVVFRFGLVLGNGGVLKTMITPFKLGLGATIGSGRQWMSWIHLDDLINAIVFSLNAGSMNGAYNLVSPNPVTNSEFTKTLSKIIRRPAFLKVPKLLIKAAINELSTLLLGGQRVSPDKLTKEGFTFKYPDLELALRNILGK